MMGDEKRWVMIGNDEMRREETGLVRMGWIGTSGWIGGQIDKYQLNMHACMPVTRLNAMASSIFSSISIALKSKADLLVGRWVGKKVRV